MDVLLTPEVKIKYEKCKTVVKVWEYEFKKKNGRLPSKLDIKEATNDIRYAYKMYFKIKSSALEQSFQDVDGFTSDNEENVDNNTPNVSRTEHTTFDESNVNTAEANPKKVESPMLMSSKVNTNKTWGSHLTNAKDKDSSGLGPKFDANSSYTLKLMKNASFSKRNLRKSLSFNHSKKDSNLDISNSLSQPISAAISSSEPLFLESSKSQDFTSLFNDSTDVESMNFLNSDTIKIVKPIEPVPATSLNLAQSVLEDSYKPRNIVDEGWLKRLATNTGTKLSNKSLNHENFALSQQISSNANYDSDNFIDDSDEEDSKLHFNKRRKLNDSVTPVPKFSQELKTIPNISQTRYDFKNILQDSSTADTAISNVVDQLIKQLDEDIESETSVTQTTQKVKAKSVARKSTRQRKTLVELETSEAIEDNPNNKTDNDPSYNIYDFNNEQEIENDKLKKSVAHKKSTAGSKKREKKPPKENNDENDDDDEQANYELEYSVKPRRVTVPRDPDFKNVLKKSKPPKKKVEEEEKDDGSFVKTKEQMKREAFEKKVASGNINDNYVRINIQKKVFARGKKTMTFSKYKKKMWKQHKKNNALTGPEMDMGGCDGGQLTCFNCGQVGHFAAKCPQAKGDKLLPLAADKEEYCPFPTLEEASQLAKESVLAIRKTRNNDASQEGPEEAENNKEVNVDMETIDGDIDDDSSDENDDNVFTKDDLFDDDDEADLLAETLKLEEHVKQLNAQQFIDESRIVPAYYNMQEDNNIIPTPQEVFNVLHMFGHENFRPGQEKAIMRILSGQSTLVTLSTGSGKSLCYQIPAYLYAQKQSCIALVISPLVSLMEDQVTGIPSFLKAECLHTNKTKVQRERILNTISTGNLNILLVSPEAVVAGEKQTGFGSLLRKLPPIAFACIDEAHCVSQWSHNFRPSYLMICSILQERLGVKTILGLTATATRATCDSIIRHLAIPDGQAGVISDIPLPNNLRLTVSKDGNRDQALLNLLLSERFETLKSIIIYCTRRQECERLASFLRTSLKHERSTNNNTGNKRKKTNVQAEPYHAGLAASKRRSIQNSFMRGDLRIVIATVAFGMGINKSDIRAVIHYNLPKNFESYVQEVGRAGRDGLPAHCHLFLDSQGRDENELQRHIFSDSIDRHVIRKLLAKIFIPCTCKGVCPKHEVAFPIDETVQLLDIPEENISTLLCYLELHDQKFIEVLSPAYVKCRVTAYGTANHIRLAAKDCPPLAMALAMFANKGNEKENIFEFPIVDVASAIGWDSGICKYKLKNLEWITENNQPKRSLISVQFQNLGFRLLAPGNLTGDQLDDCLDTLYQRVVEQEKCALLQLHSLHDTVTKVAENTYRLCITEVISEKEEMLKKCIREYFDSPCPLSKCDLVSKSVDEGLIANDVRAMLSLYRDNNFNGRALARIFYGIPSPNYPAVIWGRCKYWRAHINSDFHKIVQIATREILKYR